MDSAQRIAANRGSYHLNAADGAKTGKKWFGFVVEQDTTFTVLSGTGCDGSTAVDFLVEGQTNITGKTLKAGSFIAVSAGHTITAATISSGSAVMYTDVIL